MFLELSEGKERGREEVGDKMCRIAPHGTDRMLRKPANHGATPANHGAMERHERHLFMVHYVDSESEGRVMGVGRDK